MMRQMLKHVTGLLAVVCCYLPPTHATKILMLPFMYKSHYTQLVNIGNGLLDRGHDVYTLLSPSYPDYAKIKAGRLKVIEYTIKERDIYGMPQDEASEMLESVLELTPIQDFRLHIDGWIQFCTNPLSDAALFRTLKAENFDFAVVDVALNSRCLLILCYRLGIPYASLTTTYEPWLLRAPALPASITSQHYHPLFHSRWQQAGMLKI